MGRPADGTRVAFMIPQPPYGGMAEQTLVWEGELTAGQSVLVLGATGTSGRIAAQLATRHGGRVVAAGRNRRVLDQLVARGADAAIEAEAVFTALIHPDGRADHAPQSIRYILVGMTAGEVAALPAMTLRAAPIQLLGSGHGGQAPLEDAAAAYPSLLQQVAAGAIALAIDPMPLTQVEKTWRQAGSDRRIVFVP